MKKILLTLALAAFAFTANAQFVIGGNVGFNHQGNYDKNYTGGVVPSTTYTDNTNTAISIMPKIGYQLNDDMQIGAQLGWNYNYTRNYMGAKDSYRSTPKSAIVIAPYFRYNLLKWKKFNVFAEATVNFTLGLESKTHTFANGSEVAGSPVENNDNFTSFGFAVVPGLNYAFSNSFSMDIYVNLASIYWSATSYDNGNSEHEWGFGADMNAQPILGASTVNVGPATVMDGLNGHLTLFRIGFNYHF